MDNIKKLDNLILKATSQSNEQLTVEQLKQILQLVNSRADMSKHVIANISKRMAIKNGRVLINCFTIIEYLVYETQLALYTQIATKEFLFKISGLLMNKDLDPQIKDKIMQTIFCCEELFRPHEDLLPFFFHFYAGLLRNNFDVPLHYKSPYRPAQLKQYKKYIPGTANKVTQPNKTEQTQASVSDKKIFEEIREKLILTNQIIDNTSPADNVKDNGLLLQMIEQIKDCEKKVNKTINQNPAESLMELALAANDDIFITYRRFKDLQRNKKPEPFVLTELASDFEKQKKNNKSIIPPLSKVQNRSSLTKPPVANNPINDFLDFDEPSKKVEVSAPKKISSIIDIDFAPQAQNQTKKTAASQGGDIFDLLGSTNNQPVLNPQGNIDIFSLAQSSPQKSQTFQFEPLYQAHQPNQLQFTGLNILTTGQYQNIPQPSGHGISLNVNDFATQADLKDYSNNNVMDKLDDIAYRFLKK